MRTHLLAAVYGLGLLLLVACGGGSSKDGKVVRQDLDSPTSGKISVMVDDGYRPIIDSSIEVFESLYAKNDVKVTPIYTSEGEAVKALVKDSIQVIIITRQLTPDELVYFKNRGFVPKTTAIAHDGVGFIVNPANRDTAFTVEQIRALLTGKITKWSQLNKKSTLGDVRLVFDNALSGTVRYAKDSICAGADLSPNASALQTNTDVIDYVAKQKNAIGIISANWISDADDKGVQKFLREITLVEVARQAGEESYGPYQAYLATGQYPFKRTIYIINAQARAGLGLGFASFLAGDSGQRIVLKDGMLPAQAPIRLMKVVK